MKKARKASEGRRGIQSATKVFEENKATATDEMKKLEKLIARLSEKQAANPSHWNMAFSMGTIALKLESLVGEMLEAEIQDN